MMDNSNAANPANCYTITLNPEMIVTEKYLPLYSRGRMPDGSAELARVKVGGLYIGVGIHNNPPIGDPDVLAGAWFPAKFDRIGSKSGLSQILIVPYHTVYGQKRPARYKQLILVRGIKGSVLAPHSSECEEVLRHGSEVLLQVNSGCNFIVTNVDGVSLSIYVDSSGTHVSMPTTIGADVAVVDRLFNRSQVPISAPVEEDNSELFEYWKSLSYPKGWEQTQDKDWLDLLYTTVKSMYPKWSAKVAHIYPEPPHKSVCRPLTAATYQSPQFGSQWAIQSQYFAGFYDALHINEDLAAGSMPASRLLMRCIYEIVWLSKADKSIHPSVGSVLLTVPSLLDG